MSITNITGKLLKKFYQEDDLSFDKMASIVKKQGAENLVLTVVIAMFFKYESSHYYENKSGKDLQKMRPC